MVDATRRWLERAVIGLGLCPFAKAVHVKDQIRYAVTMAVDERELLAALGEELLHLHGCDPRAVDTTLLIHPQAMRAFDDYLWFMDMADRLLVDMGLEGELQVAHFHPQFQFHGTSPGDPGNYTNRSPFPTLHLLREDSVDRAVEAFPDAAEIYGRNIATLKALGIEGWQALWTAP